MANPSETELALNLLHHDSQLGTKYGSFFERAHSLVRKKSFCGLIVRKLYGKYNTK